MKPLPKIEKCPCGALAQIEEGAWSLGYYVLCGKRCGWGGPTMATERGAIKAWNKVMEK